MHIPQVGKLLSITLVSFGLTACGSNKVGSVISVAPSPAQDPPTTLTGNWFLAGSRVPAANPTVSTSLYVQGNVVTGQAAFFAQCTSGGVTDGISSSGIGTNDGTFQASTGTLGSPALGTTSLSLTGNSPVPATPSVWTGTYSLVFTPGSTGIPCSIAQASNFSATPIASVTGTYIGIPANSISPFGTGSVISVQITQGTPILVAQASKSGYRIPLTANLTITGSLCPFSGSTTGAFEPSFINGDSFDLVLTTGFPYGFLSGTLNDPTANTFSGDLTSLANTNGCPGIALYNFTRK